MITLRPFLSAVLTIALLGAIAVAQTPGTAFTYQGRLESSGAPSNGMHDMRFRLWLTDNDPNNPIGPTVCKDNVPVNDGLFTAELDFGTNVYTGFPLWLGVEVRPDATVGNCGSGAFTPLAPRQPLKPAPYAVFATTAQSAGLRLPFDGTTPSGVPFHLTCTSTGQNTTTGFFENHSTGNNSRALTAIANGDSGATYGVYSQNNSASGVGVLGKSSGSIGVHGQAVATSGTHSGVVGESASTGGRGVHGFATASSGATIGVFGQSASPDGYAGYFVGPRNYFSGNVGIGTAAPASRLEVNASASGLGSAVYVRNSNTGSAANFESLGTGGAPAVTCYKDDGVALLALGTFSTPGTVDLNAPLVVTGGSDSDVSGGGFLVCGGTNTTNLSIDNNEILARNNGAASSLSLNQSGGDVLLNSAGGNTGVGTTSPAYKLDVNGGMRPRAGIYFNGALPSIPEAQGGNFLSFGFPGASEDQMLYFENTFTFWDSPGGGDSSHPELRAADFVTISDVRFKTDIRPIEGALERVQRLRGIEYRYDGAKVDPQADLGASPDRLRLGFAAQEVRDVVPEAVSYTPELDVYGVSHGTIVPLLVEAIKEQQAMIGALRAELDELKSRQLR